MLLGKGHCFGGQVIAFCPQCGKPADDDDLQLALAGGSLATIRSLVAGGAGVTIFPGTAACADRFPQRLLSIRRFAGKQPSWRVVLAWRASFTRDQAIAVLKESILASGLTGVRMLHGNTK